MENAYIYISAMRYPFLYSVPGRVVSYSTPIGIVSRNDTYQDGENKKKEMREKYGMKWRDV